MSPPSDATGADHIVVFKIQFIKKVLLATQINNADIQSKQFLMWHLV